MSSNAQAVGFAGCSFPDRLGHWKNNKFHIPKKQIESHRLFVMEFPAPQHCMFELNSIILCKCGLQHKPTAAAISSWNWRALDKNSFFHWTTCMLIAKGEWIIRDELNMREWINIGRNIFPTWESQQPRHFFWLMIKPRAPISKVLFQSSTNCRDCSTFQYYIYMGVSKNLVTPNLKTLFFLLSNKRTDFFSGVGLLLHLFLKQQPYFTKWPTWPTWMSIVFLGPGARHIASRRGPPRMKYRKVVSKMNWDPGGDPKVVSNDEILRCFRVPKLKRTLPADFICFFVFFRVLGWWIHRKKTQVFCCCYGFGARLWISKNWGNSGVIGVITFKELKKDMFAKRDLPFEATEISAHWMFFLMNGMIW